MEIFGLELPWWLTLITFFGLLLALMSTGMPVAIAFALLNIIGLFMVKGTTGLLLLPGSVYRSVATFNLLAIPMFFLLGEILFQSRVIGLTIDVMDRWIGRVRARLLFTSLGAGTALATLSGAGMADTALLGTTLYPEMEKRGYDRRLSLGTLMSSGLLAAIIPPSALAVLVGSLAEVSIARLLIAGFLPGLMMAGVYGIYIWVRVRMNPTLAPPYVGEPIGWRPKLTGAALLSPLGIIVLMVMGFIILGVTTPSEAAATGASGAFVVAAIYSLLRARIKSNSLDGVRFNYQVIKDASYGTVYIGGMIFLIITGAVALGQLLAFTGATREFLHFIVGLAVPTVVLVIIVHLAVLLLGFFIDQLSIMLVAIPVLIPIVEGLGIDPVWFWVLFLMNISIGAITPPFGMMLFALKGVVPQASMSDLYKASIPFVLLDMVALGLVIAFPPIATWLPSLIS